MGGEGQYLCILYALHNVLHKWVMLKPVLQGASIRTTFMFDVFLVITQAISYKKRLYQKTEPKNCPKLRKLLY